jgi:hypothetical protein
MWTTIEPRRQPINIDCHSYREVLQACFRQAPVATLTQPKGADALREGPFNANAVDLRHSPMRALYVKGDIPAQLNQDKR